MTKAQVLLRFQGDKETKWRVIKKGSEFYLELYETELDENKNIWNRVYYFERLTEDRVSEIFAEHGKTWIRNDGDAGKNPADTGEPES